MYVLQILSLKLLFPSTALLLFAWSHGQVIAYDQLTLLINPSNDVGIIGFCFVSTLRAIDPQGEYL